MISKVINQDCRTFLSECWLNFDFVFADPPFNIGQPYNEFNDSMDELSYQRFTLDWIDGCWQKLKNGCAMVIHGSPKVNTFFYRSLLELGLLDHIERELIWSFAFGQNTFENFVETHCRATVLRKPGFRKWYPENIMVESTRLRMGDKRVLQSKYKGLVCPGTVWGLKNSDGIVLEPIEGEYRWCRVQGNNPERKPHSPNQLPERYLIRLIGAYTEPNDVVFDPFGGTGTTATVAISLGRHAVTTEISKTNCVEIEKRILKGLTP